MPGAPYVTDQTLAEKAAAWKQAVDPSAENALTSLIHPALLIIDVQHYFIHPRGRAYLPAARTTLPRIQMLIGAFRRAGFPVVYTRHGHIRGEDAGLMERWWRGRLLFEDDPQAELVPEVEATEERMVIGKHHYDAFKDTGLAAALHRLDVEMAVICGVMTDLCVESTARTAFMEGFQPVVALDATASKNEELHLAALKTLAHGFAYVDNAQRIVELIA